MAPKARLREHSPPHLIGIYLGVLLVVLAGLIPAALYVWAKAGIAQRASADARTPQWEGVVVETLGNTRSLLAFTAVYGVLGVLLVLAVLRLIRAGRPGIVDLSITNDPSELGVGVMKSAELFSALRQSLASVNLQAPSTLPGESVSQDFLTDVRSTARRGDSSIFNVVVIALTTLFSTRPEHFVVVGPRLIGDRPALTLQVSHRRSRDSRVVTAEGEDWADAVAKAAAHVAAAILPRTSLARSAPWTPWRGRIIDGQLFYHFQEGRRFASAQRYEEALSHFEAALKLDPLNPYIRLERASVMEQTGLYIDALATYVDIVHIESNYDRRLRRRLVDAFPTRGDEADRLAAGRRGRAPNGPDALQIARFRMVVALASSNRLSEQWWRRSRIAADAPLELRDSRQIEAAAVIEKLHPLLHIYATALADTYSARNGTPLPLLRLPGRHIQSNLPTLRRVLQFAALYEAELLERDYRRLRGRRFRSLPISQSVLRIVPPWAAVQYRYVEAVQARPQPPTDPPTDMGRLVPPELVVSTKLLNVPMTTYERVVRFRWWQWRRWTFVPTPKDLSEHQWPPPPQGLARLVERAFRRRPQRFIDWQEYYSAACLFAVGMLTPELGDDPTADDALAHVELIQSSLVTLEKAVIAQGSALADASSPWLNMGDENLDDLRYTARYRTFVSRFFPGASAVTRLPVNVALLTMSRHTTNLVGQFAAAQFRGLNALRDANMPLSAAELREQAAAWDMLSRYCRSYRDWRVRADLIRHGMRADRAGFDPTYRGLDVELDDALTKLVHLVDRETERDGLAQLDSVNVDPRVRELARTRNYLQRSKAIQVRGQKELIEGRDRALNHISFHLDQDPEPSISEYLTAVWERGGLDPDRNRELLTLLLLAWEQIGLFAESDPREKDAEHPAMDGLRRYLRFLYPFSSWRPGEVG